ncbi:TetR/AcrR family transcriptional regulator [Kitasatospora sp. NBC_01539]|uniref:TetR/AcrR family transcriptional regulator n=1 Tax=Kitasatospora sp. NBC_01539 TaxID=2903577 RepID=UPI003860156A
MARAGLTTDRVVRAAADLSDEVGFDRITVSALARGFGVKDASLYSHVRSLEDLRIRVALLAIDDFAARITDAVAGRAGRDALGAFAHAYRRFARDHPGRYAATQLRPVPAAVASSPGAQHILRSTYALLLAYGLAEPDATDAVRLLRSTFHGFADLEARSGFDHPRPVSVSFDRAVDALHQVLGRWAAAPSAENG